MAAMHACMPQFFFFFVGHHVSHLVHLHVGHHVHLHVGRHVSHHVGHRNVVSTLCEVSDTLTEWKSEQSDRGRC